MVLDLFSMLFLQFTNIFKANNTISTKVVNNPLPGINLAHML